MVIINNNQFLRLKLRDLTGLSRKLIVSFSSIQKYQIQLIRTRVKKFQLLSVIYKEYTKHGYTLLFNCKRFIYYTSNSIDPIIIFLQRSLRTKYSEEMYTWK